ncbi:MAG: hypothetical protein IIY21_25370 [Clostridiales bacterium]|nr:hypothetical protein [Clostridiales bacterium]
MDLTLSLSLCITIGGILVSVATAFAVVKTKVSALEEEVAEAKNMATRLKDEREDLKVRIAVLERNQAAHTDELAEIKSDIKTTMKNVQEIKEAILTLKKGEV